MGFHFISMKQNYLLLLPFLFISCSSSNTRITRLWINKEKIRGQHLESVFIAVLTPHPDVQTTIENELAYQANQLGIKTYKSHNLFTKSFTEEEMPSKEQLNKIIEATKAKTFFTIAIVDKKTLMRHVPGHRVYAPVMMPYGYLDNFYLNYSYMFSPQSVTVYNTSYYTIDKIYYIESKLYDIETQELLWTAKSKTFRPYDIESLTKGYTQTLFKKLKRKGIIRDM